MADYNLPFTGDQTAEYLAKARDFSGVPLDDGLYTGSKTYTTYDQYLNDNGALFKLNPTVALGYAINIPAYPEARNDPNLIPYTSFESAGSEAIADFNTDGAAAIVDFNADGVDAINQFNVSGSQALNDFVIEGDEAIAFVLAETDGALGALGGIHIGEYLADPLITERNQYVTFGVSPTATQWKITDSTSLDHQIDSTTYPDPEDDPALIMFNDVTREYVNSNFDKAGTLSSFVNDPNLSIDGGRVKVSDRCDALFNKVLASSVTTNDIDIIECVGAPTIALQIVQCSNVSFEMLGGAGDYLILGVPHTINPSPTDNFPIVERAYAMGIRTLYAGNGTYSFATGNLNVFTDKPFTIEGVGAVQPEILGGTLVQIYTTGTVLVNNSTNFSLFNLGSPSSFLTNASALRHLSIACSDDQLPNQHALFMEGHMMSFTLEDVTFVNITGYSWLWDTSSNPYSQNLNWRDVSMYNVGGIMGNNGDPVGSANKIFATLFEFDNFNFEHQINPVSPQTYICDFRGVRGINGTNFLIEGADGGGTNADEYIRFGSDENVVINNMHLEGLSGFPSRWFTFADTRGLEWLGDSNALIIINGFEGASDGTIHFEKTKQRCVINGFRRQNSFASWSDIITFNTDYVGASLHINNADTRTGFRSLVPESLKGRVTVRYAQSTSASGLAIPAKNSPIASILAPIFRYRPNQQGDTVFTGIGTPYGDTFTQAGNTQNAIATFSNTLVNTIERSDNRGAFIGIDFTLPAYMIGTKITVVARYFWEGTRAFSPFQIFDVDFDEETELSRSDYHSNWVTAVATFTAVKSVFSLTSDSATTGADTPKLHLAAYDVFLGCEYIEPLDLRKT